MSIYAGVQGKKEVFDGYASLGIEKKRLVSVWGNKEGKKEELFNVFPKNSFIANGSPLYYSQDGATWAASTGLIKDLDHILLSYVKDRFICLCGQHSSSSSSDLKMFSSFDGLNWVEILTEEMKELNSLDPDNSPIVNWAFSEEKIVLRRKGKSFSFDGKRWIKMSGIENEGDNEVAYGNGRFVVLNKRTNYSSTYSYYSIDGVEWLLGGEFEKTYYDLYYTDGLFFAIENDKASKYSYDGIAWTTATGLPLGSYNTIDNIVYINGNTYCRVIELDSNRNEISSALYRLNKEVMEWEYFSELPTSDLRSITNVNDKFLGYNSGSFYSSEDGVTWTEVSSPYSSTTLIIFTYGDGKVVVLTQEASVISLCSKDEGVTWFDSKYGSIGNFYDKKKKRLLKCERVEIDGVYYLIQYSYDGKEWKPLLNGPISTSSSSSRSLSKIIYANGRYVAVGKYGLSFYSLDGEEWLEMSGLRTSSSSYDVCFGGGIFVAFGTSGICYSTDGVTWLTPTTQPSSTLNSIAYGNGKFVAVAASGKSFYSVDGNVWTASTGLNTAYSYKVAYGNGKFVALPQSTLLNATLYYSSDGITWTALTTDTKIYSSGDIVFANGRFVLLTGAFGTYFNYYSFDGIEWMAGDDTRILASNFIAIGDESEGER